MVVSDTSPLSNLAIIGHLDLARQQFGSVIIPEAVWAELNDLEHPEGRIALINAHQAGWLIIEKATDRALVNMLCKRLDIGEAESIALALGILPSAIPEALTAEFISEKSIQWNAFTKKNHVRFGIC